MAKGKLWALATNTSEMERFSKGHSILWVWIKLGKSKTNEKKLIGAVMEEEVLECECYKYEHKYKYIIEGSYNFWQAIWCANRSIFAGQNRAGKIIPELYRFIYALFVE